MFMLNGKPLAIDTPFRDANGVQYPANWLRLTTWAEKEAIGITEEPDPVEPIPVVPLEEQKRRRIAQIDAKTRELIAKGFTYNGSTFSMSDAAQKNWLLLAVGVALGMVRAGAIPVASTTEETPYVFADMQDVQGFLAAYASYQSAPTAPLATGRTLKAAVVEAADEEALAAVVDDRT